MDVRHSFFRTGSGRRRTLIGLTSAALVAGGIAGVAVATPANAAGAPVVISIEGVKSAMTANAYDATGAVAATQQTLNANKNCNQGTPVDGSLLSLAAAGPTASAVGIYGLSMGVTDSSTSNGAACSQVNTTSPSEALTLTVTVPSSSALFAVLDIEVQKNVVVTAVASLAGGGSQSYELRTGTSTNGFSATSTTTLCNKGATSSGSNNSSTDNCKWTIYSPGQRFTSLTLTASNTVSGGQFSIEGGSDWGTNAATAKNGPFPVNASYFYLGEGCTTNNSTVTLTSPSGKVVNATYVPDNVNIDSSPCVSTSGKTLTTDGSVLTLTNPNASAFEQGTVRATWTAAPGTPAKSSTDVNFVPTSNANYGNYWITMPWCPSTLFNSDGTRKTLTGISSDPAQAATQLAALGLSDQDFATSANNPLPNNNRFQYACVVERRTVYVPASGTTAATFQTTDTLYLIGDVVWRG